VQRTAIFCAYAAATAEVIWSTPFGDVYSMVVFSVGGAVAPVALVGLDEPAEHPVSRTVASAAMAKPPRIR
jgi:hypothetical protein